MRPDIDKGGRTPIKRADFVNGKKIRGAVSESVIISVCLSEYVIGCVCVFFEGLFLFFVSVCLHVCDCVCVGVWGCVWVCECEFVFGFV